MADILITRPRHDLPTYYLFFWSEEIIEEAKKKGLEIVDLSLDKATKKNFQSYLRKDMAKVVIVNGHGTQDSVFGHDNEVLFKKGDGDDLLKDKIIYVRACDCGSELGMEVMSKGALGFIGYANPFMFPYTAEGLNSPTEDELASPVLKCSNTVGLSIVKGKSAFEAHEDSIYKYKETIQELTTSKYADTHILPFLHWNMTNQVYFSR